MIKNWAARQAPHSLSKYFQDQIVGWTPNFWWREARINCETLQDDGEKSRIRILYSKIIRGICIVQDNLLVYKYHKITTNITKSQYSYTQYCSCHATQQDGVLPGRSNRQQSPAGPVNMSRSRTPVAYCLGRQSKLRPFNIGAVYIGSGKPQSCQKPKDKYSTGREYPLLPPSIYACHIYRWNGRFQCTRWLCACSVDLQSGFEPNTMNLPRLPLPSSSGKRLTSHVGSGGIYLFYARQSRH